MKKFRVTVHEDWSSEWIVYAGNPEEAREFIEITGVDEQTFPDEFLGREFGDMEVVKIEDITEGE